MKKKTKKALLIAALAVVAAVPLTIGALAVNSLLNPWVPEREVFPAAEYEARGEKLMDEQTVDFLYGYLDNFGPETEADAKDEADRERIRQKNELLTEYRSIADGMCEAKVLKLEEYEVKYNYLMELFSRLLELEPPPTEEERFASELGGEVLSEREKIQFERNYIFEVELQIEQGDYEDADSFPAEKKQRLQRIAQMEELLAELEALEKDYESGKLSFEEARSRYNAHKIRWDEVDTY